MSTGRRDVLRVIAGATMYAAAGSLRGSFFRRQVGSRRQTELAPNTLRTWY